MERIVANIGIQNDRRNPGQHLQWIVCCKQFLQNSGHKIKLSEVGRSFLFRSLSYFNICCPISVPEPTRLFLFIKVEWTLKLPVSVKLLNQFLYAFFATVASSTCSTYLIRFKYSSVTSLLGPNTLLGTEFYVALKLMSFFPWREQTANS
jgi:hypothetical protein